MAPIAGRDITMGGIEITVEGGDVRLTGVSSDVATTVETHTMAMVDDRMQMRPVDGWDLKAGDTLKLDRGGDHLMFFGVDEALAAGDTANVTFYFDVEGREEPLTLEAEAEVRGMGESKARPLSPTSFAARQGAAATSSIRSRVPGT